MKALMLAAGYGTRLYEIVKDRPKALLDINGKSIANYILDRLEQLPGLKEVIVVTNDKFFGNFQEWAQAQTDFPHPINIVNDGTTSPQERLGSIGDIDFVIKQCQIQDDLLIVGGDNLFDYNVDDYIRFAQNLIDNVTIGLYDINDFEGAKKFGVVELADNGKIISFEEKPEHPKTTLVGMCFYYLPKKTVRYIVEYLEEVKESDTTGDYIRWLLEKKEIYGFKFTGTWYDIGSVESYHDAQKHFKG